MLSIDALRAAGAEIAPPNNQAARRRPHWEQGPYDAGAALANAGLFETALAWVSYPIVSYLGQRDPAGHVLQATILALADERGNRHEADQRHRGEHAHPQHGSADGVHARGEEPRRAGAPPGAPGLRRWGRSRSARPAG